MIGFHSDMMWLPEHGVGAVILTNGDPGWLVRTMFRRKLLEVLFDGRAEADASDRGGGEDVLRRAGRRAQAPHRPGRSGAGGQARRALRNTPRSARSS